MSRLSDTDILEFRRLGLLDVTPWNVERLQAASYDLTLGCYIARHDWDGGLRWDTEKFETSLGDRLYTRLDPGEFALFSTVEHVTVSASVAAAVAGKSSNAREGIAVEFAGWIDPGFSGQLTLEIKNLLPYAIRLEAGEPICQVIFEELRTRALRPYGERGHYQGQTGPTKSWRLG